MFQVNSNPIVSENRVVAMEFDGFLLFDADDPDAAPEVFEADAETTTAPAFDGRFVVFTDFSSGEVMVLDTSDSMIANLGIRSAGAGVNNITVSQEALDIGAGVICGFNAAETYGITYQSFISDAAGGALALAPDQDLSNETSAGWGDSCAVTPDGQMAFIGGIDGPSGRCCDKLAVWTSTGISISFAGDIGPARDSEGNVIAANPVMGNGIVAFRLAAPGELATLGYVVLP